MFVIVCYDVGVKRGSKVLKLMRSYLRPVQKSVFDGYLSEKQINSLTARLRNLIDPEKDAVVIYRFLGGVKPEKDCLGKSLKNESFIL